MTFIITASSLKEPLPSNVQPIEDKYVWIIAEDIPIGANIIVSYGPGGNSGYCMLNYLVPIIDITADVNVIDEIVNHLLFIV